jgi:hypothetical protein
VSEVANGTFKVMVRTQEFNNSGTEIVDVCVANVEAHQFPGKAYQCFLKGYDFGTLSVKWLDPQVIEVSFHTEELCNSKTLLLYIGMAQVRKNFIHSYAMDVGRTEIPVSR